MNISDLLLPDAVLPKLRAKTKSQLLKKLAACGYKQTRLPEKHIFEGLMESERVGSTGVGRGIAIPHSRLAGANRVTGVFAKLEIGVDYAAVDSRPVDLVFMLLAPVSAGVDHLKALARVSHLLRNQAICEKLRGAASAEAIYAILTRISDDQTACAPSGKLINKSSTARNYLRRDLLSRP